MALFIFDYDGTLSDTIAVICDCMRDAFKKEDLLPPSDIETRQIIGITLDKAIMILLKERSDPVLAEKITEHYKNIYRYKRENNLLEDGLFSGAKDILKEIENAGHIAAIATGKSWKGLEAEVIRHNIKNYFVSLECADFHPSKPHPSMILKILDETGTSPSDAYMIGDSIYDIEMAKAASVTPIGVSWGAHDPQKLKEVGAKMILRKMSDLEMLIG